MYQSHSLMTDTYYLPAKKMKLRQREDGALTMNLDGQSIELAQPKRALPLTDPDRFIVLSDEDGNELGVVRDINELDCTSREALNQALHRAYVIQRITRILKVERDTLSGQTRWWVEVAVGDDATDGASAADHAVGVDGDSALRKIRWFRPKDKDGEADADGLLSPTPIATEEREFSINGQEDIQTARYPHIYIVDTDRNRYEILNCEALDVESRLAAERYF